jgi:uncharacterized repeat protein (TIGR01451 family)
MNKYRFYTLLGVLILSLAVVGTALASDNTILPHTPDAVPSIGTTHSGEAGGNSLSTSYLAFNPTSVCIATDSCDGGVQPYASISPDQQYEWAKYINSEEWTPGISITLQTSDTLQVTEIITTVIPFTLIENWNPEHLSLLGYEISPGGIVIVTPGYLEWHQTPTGPGPWFIIKWFHIEPCTWTDTILDEVLFVDGLLPEPRPVFIFKLPPELWIDSLGGDPVFAGQPADFTLLYGNQGGFENATMVRNDFPPEAPFFSSIPPPDRQDPGGLWAEWDVGDLPQGAQGNIDVTVMIQPGVPPSTTIEIWDGIFNHVDELADWVIIPFHVEPIITWDKIIDGIPWAPGMEITHQTSDTIVVQEVLHLMPLPPINAAVTPVLAPPNPLPDFPADLTTQVNNPYTPVTPRNPEAVLWDQTMGTNTAGVSDYMTNLYLGAFSADDFQNPEAWAIDTIFVDGWDIADDLLRASLLTWYIYPDAGGVPAGYPGDGSGTELWSLSLLPNDPAVTIGLGVYEDVTLDVIMATGGTLNLPPGHYWLVFYPSLDQAPGLWYWRFTSTSNLNHPQVIDPTNYFGYGWTSWTDWTLYDPTYTDMAFRLEGIVQPPIFAQIETWDPTRLHLLDWAATGGQIIVEPDRLTWTDLIVAQTTITLTKWFHVEPCTWTQTVLWEELWLDNVELEQRPVIIDKMPPVLWIDALGGGPVLAGQPANFILQYGNLGGFENATMVRNTFPTEAPFQASIPPPSRQDPGGLWAEWDTSDLPTGAQGNIDVTVLIQPGVPPSTTIEIWDGIFNHVGELADWVIIPFHVEPTVDLTVVKDAPAEVFTGETFSYTITVTNIGPDDAMGVTLTDTLPTSYVSYVSSPGCIEDSGVVTCDIGVLPAGGSVVRNVYVIAIAVGTAHNNAEVMGDNYDPNLGNNLDTADTLINLAISDLAISKSGEPDSVRVGQNITYTLVITNYGPVAAPGVMLEDTLPVSVTFSSASLGCIHVNGVVTCDIGFMAVGDSALRHIVVTSNAVGIAHNTAEVWSDITDPNPSNNTDSEDTLITPALSDLAISKSGEPDSVRVGQTITYTLVITNFGPEAATGVILEDTLPVSVTFSSASPGCIHVGGVVTCNVGSIAVGDSVLRHIVVAANAPGIATNTAIVGSEIVDPNPTNNIASADTLITPAISDLTVIKSDNADPVFVGDYITYTLVVTNYGPDATTGVMLTDTLPISVNFVSADAGCTHVAGVVTCDIGDLAVDGSVTLHIIVIANAVGTATNLAEVWSDNNDPNPLNNIATEDTVINPTIFTYYFYLPIINRNH